MKFAKRLFTILLFPVLAVLLFSSCKEDDVKPSSEVLEINEFIWENMNDLYLWDDFIPQNIDRTDEFHPKSYFKKLLYQPTDKWSYITDDHEALINYFKGIEKSFGHNFKLFQIPGSSNIIGIIKYVVPNSPADLAGIARGDVFNKVNGVILQSDNYYDLLYNNDSYTLSFSEFVENGQLAFVEDKSLSAIVMTENPIFINKTIDFEGTKIGYLAYNHFIMDFNDQLISAFNQFKSDGITDLVLDLRYNPGGAIDAAVLLSSMLAPTSVVQNNDIFTRTFWNNKFQEYWLEEEGEESPNLITKFMTTEVNLNLERIYILTTSNSASASELVINCLNPYMEVIIVGEGNTSGKYVGSITVHDEEKSHGWALQPIVMKAANVDGISDYSDGFAPHYFVADDFNAELGSLGEDMLAKSVELITGKTLSDPARIARSNIPKNMIEILNPKVEETQQMYLNR